MLAELRAEQSMHDDCFMIVMVHFMDAVLTKQLAKKMQQAQTVRQISSSTCTWTTMVVILLAKMPLVAMVSLCIQA